jgi:hypothetical protein
VPPAERPPPSGTPFSLQVGSVVQTGNGNNLSAGCNDPSDPNTSKLSYVQSALVVGFATFEVTNVRCKVQGQGQATDPLGAGVCAQFATSQCISVRLVCDAQDDEPVPLGCGWWGTSPLRPLLAR